LLLFLPQQCQVPGDPHRPPERVRFVQHVNDIQVPPCGDHCRLPQQRVLSQPVR
jgi:hypothetical protein